MRPHKTCALLMEVRGREIRTTQVNDEGGVVLRSGQELTIGCDNAIIPSDNKRIQCNYRDLPKLVKPNDIIYIDDGKIVCLVTDCEPVTILTLMSIGWRASGSERWWLIAEQTKLEVAEWQARVLASATLAG